MKDLAGFRRRRELAVGLLPLFVLVGLTAPGQAEGASPLQQAATSEAASPAISSDTGGAAFAMTNESDHNRIIEYRRAANGVLTRVGSIATRGRGLGTDLDTQGGVRLSSDHHFLYAVNAGSDAVSVFSVNKAHLTFVQQVYAGDEPNSLTLHGNLLYVLDGSVAGNGIRGFRVGDGGRLTALAHSFRLLSSPIAVPGQVEFSPDGRYLLVTEKTTNELLAPKDAIDAFRVQSDGRPSALPKRDASLGIRPFSLAFRKDGTLVVAESFNAAPGRSAVSSYRLSANGSLHGINGSVRNTQTDTCWIVITKDGRNVYTANFGSGTISRYRYDSAGHLRLVEARAAFLGLLSQPVDLALSEDSRYLYLLLRGTGGVASFAISDTGALKPLGVVKGVLPVADGASGMDAY